MGSNSVLPDYDHVIVDSNGIRGVKDGREFPVSEEDWKKAHPEHQNTECKECTFVLDAGTILALHVPKEVRDNATSKPKFVGKFTMPGWNGHSGFYLFKCLDCDKTYVDYPHGYRGNGCLYIRCGQCRFEIVLTPRKYKEIYRQESVVPPSTLWETIKNIWALRKVYIKVFLGSLDDEKALQRPLNVEDQEKLKIPGRVPTELES